MVECKYPPVNNNTRKIGTLVLFEGERGESTLLKNVKMSHKSISKAGKLNFHLFCALSFFSFVIEQFQWLDFAHCVKNYDARNDKYAEALS
jgi:hypothetical protein